MKSKMKKFVAALTFVLLLAAGVCHAAPDKIYFGFYDYNRNELTQQIKTDITTELEDATNIEMA